MKGFLFDYGSVYIIKFEDEKIKICKYFKVIKIYFN